MLPRGLFFTIWSMHNVRLHSDTNNIRPQSPLYSVPQKETEWYHKPSVNLQSCMLHLSSWINLMMSYDGNFNLDRHWDLVYVIYILYIIEISSSISEVSHVKGPLIVLQSRTICKLFQHLIVTVEYNAELRMHSCSRKSRILLLKFFTHLFTSSTSFLVELASWIRSVGSQGYSELALQLSFQLEACWLNCTSIEKS